MLETNGWQNLGEASSLVFGFWGEVQIGNKMATIYKATSGANHLLRTNPVGPSEIIVGDLVAVLKSDTTVILRNYPIGSIVPITDYK